VHDLPDEVSVTEASDEIDPLREALGREKRPVKHVHDDRPTPHASAAGVLGRRASVVIGYREDCCSNLWSSFRLLVSKCRIRRRPDGVGSCQREKSARVALDRD
jgi:hypothetical protein